MKKLPNRDERIIEAVEVCRPGRDDMSDPVLVELLEELAVNPELAEHCERLQQCDANLVSAFQSVPVPDGLDRRLLARLEQAAEETPAATPIRPKHRLRRRLLVGGGFAVVAASLVIAAMVYYSSPPYTQSSVLQQSVAFFQVDLADPGEFVEHSPPPEAYPLSRSVARVQQIQWRPIGDFLGRKGVAYDLPVGCRATLYVVRQTVPGLVTNPPLRPQKNTGGLSAATWQEGDLLYVLVLHGNRSSTIYRNLVDLPRGPLI
jgi:hypothetical protein